MTIEPNPDPIDNGMFPHKCEAEGCTYMVNYDDEPYCFKHSPDSGSSVKGYSARAKAAAQAEHPAYEPPAIESIEPVERNIFDEPPKNA